MIVLLLTFTHLCNGYIFRYVKSRNYVAKDAYRDSKLHASDGDSILSALQRSSFNLQEEFWVTPESLSIEVLISRAERSPRRESKRKWLTTARDRILSLIGYQSSSTIDRSTIDQEQIKPPLLFIHGSFHSAWCFAENFMPFFTSRGHDCYAISLRGTAATGMPPDDPGETVRIEKHVEDVNYVLEELLSRYREEAVSIAPPVIIAHSFGGMITMKLLEKSESLRKKLSGVILLCSVPPSGNGKMTQRFLRRNLIQALKITYGFVFKAVTTNIHLCRELFFDGKDDKQGSSVSEKDLSLYMQRFAVDSRVGLDVFALNDVLPSKTSMDPVSKKAVWLMERTEEEENNGDLSLVPERLVIGGKSDSIIDREGIEETARYLDCAPAVMIDHLYHDVMLGERWLSCAQVIEAWLQEKIIDRI